MSLDSHEVVLKVASQLTAHPNAALQIIAERLGIAAQVVEESLHEVEGVSFHEFRASKRLAQAFDQLGENSPAVNGPDESRRGRRRVIIPKTTVRYQPHSPWLWMRESNYSTPCPLVDLSREGLAFLADQALRPEKQISMLLKFPGGEEIPRLKGRVIYVVATGIAGYRYRVGVQFLPFVDRRSCNAIKVLNLLTNLEQTYAPYASDKT
jgi:hypothetical protein